MIGAGSFARRHSQTWLLGRRFSFTEGADEGEVNVSVLRFVQNARWRGEEQVAAVRSTFSWGIDAWNATINDTGPVGRFFSWLGQTQYARRLGEPGHEIVLRGDLQVAADPLVSIEQYAVGGLFYVRGYRRNEIVRDSGWVASAEWRYPLFRLPVPRLEAGVDFVRTIDEAVASCRFMIALIGRHWLSPRLAKPTDYVRVEIAAALRRDIRVIPVLVDGAEMPRAEDLPNDVALITRRNGLPLNHAQFESDVERLIEAIAPQRRDAQPMNSDVVHATSPRIEVSKPRETAQLTLQYQNDIEPIWRWVAALVTLIFFFSLGYFIGSVVESATESDNPLPIIIGTVVWIAGVVATIWAWRCGAASAFRMWKRWTALPLDE